MPVHMSNHPFHLVLFNDWLPISVCSSYFKIDLSANSTHLYFFFSFFLNYKAPSRLLLFINPFQTSENNDVFIALEMVGGSEKNIRS